MGVYYFHLLQSCLPTYLATMATRKGSKATYVGTNYFTSSDEDQEEIENLELPDFEPFMASYGRYRVDLPVTEKQQLMHKGLCNIR